MYKFIQAVEYVDKPKEIGTSKWALVKGQDGVVYQVKFNQTSLSSNINEFIGNCLGFLIGVPVPDGNFLMIPDNILEECINNLGFTIDMETVKNNLFFGIKWMYGQVNFSNTDLLLEELKNSSNYKEYPSIFPYDQYLRNADRHVDNHLIIKYNENGQISSEGWYKNSKLQLFIKALIAYAVLLPTGLTTSSLNFARILPGVKYISY